MATRKIFCDVCDVEISTNYNFKKHLLTKKHLHNVEIKNHELNKLRKWSKDNHIHMYEYLSLKDLKNIKQNFNKSDYKLLNYDKLFQIGKRLYVIDLEKLSREEFYKNIKKY